MPRLRIYNVINFNLKNLILFNYKNLSKRGPVLQAGLVPIGFPGIIDITGFRLNMYTSPAFLSALIYLILLILITFKFNEYVVLDSNVIEKTTMSINAEGKI